MTARSACGKGLAFKWIWPFPYIGGVLYLDIFVIRAYYLGSKLGPPPLILETPTCFQVLHCTALLHSAYAPEGPLQGPISEGCQNSCLVVSLCLCGCGVPSYCYGYARGISAYILEITAPTSDSFTEEALDPFRQKAGMPLRITTPRAPMQHRPARHVAHGI